VSLESPDTLMRGSNHIEQRKQQERPLRREMRLKHFFRWFLLAVGLQLFFIFGGYVLFVGPAAGKPFRNDVLLALYSPFIHFVIALGGYSGESGMIWPPVFGVLLGYLFIRPFLQPL
jgi:hypothetical protein